MEKFKKYCGFIVLFLNCIFANCNHESKRRLFYQQNNLNLVDNFNLQPFYVNFIIQHFLNNSLNLNPLCFKQLSNLRKDLLESLEKPYSELPNYWSRRGALVHSYYFFFLFMFFWLYFVFFKYFIFDQWLTVSVETLRAFSKWRVIFFGQAISTSVFELKTKSGTVNTVSSRQATWLTWVGLSHQ